MLDRLGVLEEALDHAVHGPIEALHWHLARLDAAALRALQGEEVGP